MNGPSSARASGAAEEPARGFTSRAFTMHYSPAAGWHKPQLLPRAQCAPAAAGPEGARDPGVVAEGLKVYRRIDGTVAAFRPWEHARRFRWSARRAAIPALPDDLFVSAVEELVEADAAALGGEPGSSLHLRALIHLADEPQTPYPLREYRFVLTARQNCAERVEEPSLFVVRPGRPRAEVSLLEREDAAPRGVTPESVLTLASRLGYIVREECVTPDRWRRARGDRAGQEPAEETFVCTTADGVVPVGDGEPGPVTLAIRQALLDAQCGREPAPRGWVYQIPSIYE